MSVHPPISLDLNGPNYVEGLVMPDDSARALLPEDIQRKLAIIEEEHDRRDSAVVAATAAASDAHEAWVIAKSNRERLESQSVIEGSNISKAQLDLAREKEARAKKLKGEGDAKPQVALRERDVVRQVAAGVTKLIQSARTYEPMRERAGPMNIIGERGKFAGFDLSDAPDVKLSGDLRDIVTTQRGLNTGLHIEQKAIAGAPLPRESVESRLIADLDKAAARAVLGVDLGERGHRDPSVRWPVRGNDSIFRTEGGKLSMHVDAEAFIARFHRDELVAEIQAALDKAYASVEMALDPGEANQRLKDIKRTLVEAERIECAAIWRLLEDGATDVFFRPDTNPRAILGVM
jgi:hypothetical protein